MAERQCQKCGESTDEAKAFCPGCGTALVNEEKRRTTSEFEMVDSTVKLGHSMYNQMLSEMGLDLSKRSEGRVETVEPAAPAPDPRKTDAISAGPARARSPWVWIVALAVAVVALAFVVVAVAALIFYLTAGRT